MNIEQAIQQLDTLVDNVTDEEKELVHYGNNSIVFLPDNIQKICKLSYQIGVSISFDRINEKPKMWNNGYNCFIGVWNKDSYKKSLCSAINKKTYWGATLKNILNKEYNKQNYIGVFNRELSEV